MKQLLFIALVLHVVCSQTVVPLTSGQTNTLNAVAGSYTYYSIPVAANQEIDIQAAFSVSNTWYFRANSYPTTTVYDQLNEPGTGNVRWKVTSCKITDQNLAGTMYIIVRPYYNLSGGQFTVTVRNQLCETPLFMNATLDSTFLQTDEYRNYYIDVTEANVNEFRFTAQLLSGSTSYNMIFYNSGLRATSAVYMDSWSVSNTRTISLTCLSVGRHYISFRHQDNGFKTLSGSFQNRLRPCTLPITSGFIETYDALSSTSTYYTIDVAEDNFLNIQLQEITADYANIYVQKDRLPTTSDYLTRYTGSTNSKFLSIGPCELSAGTYYIGVFVDYAGQYQIKVNTVPHKCVTPVNATYTEEVTIHDGQWLYYTYDVSDQNQFVVFTAQQVDGSMTAYAQRDAQPTSSYYAYRHSGTYKSLPFDSCDIKKDGGSNLLYFALASDYDQSTAAISMKNQRNLNCSSVLESGVPFPFLTFWAGDTQWNTNSHFQFEVTEDMSAMPIRVTVTSSSYQTIYLAKDRTPTTSDYDYYGGSITVPLASYATGTWHIMVRGYLVPFTITASFDAAAPIAVPAANPSAAPASSPSATPTIDACNSYTSCSSCIQLANCGWCNNEQQCQTGGSLDSYSGCSGGWNFYQCPAAPISTPTITTAQCQGSSCSTCFAETGCTWCGASNSCVLKANEASVCPSNPFVNGTQCAAPGAKVSAAVFSPILSMMAALVLAVACVVIM